jgi:chemotaxis signal transduction protein
MVLYKGVELHPDLAVSIRYMQEVDEYREELRLLQGTWDNLALLGHLSGTRIEIGAVRSEFSSLTAKLVHQLGDEQRRKVALEAQSKAQVAIDILVRNLFERTADIGFLATDAELRAFVDAAPDARERTRAALVARFHDYQRKYSVYSEVFLLDADGEVLARLSEDPAPPRSADPLIDLCLRTQAPYVEVYRRLDIAPGAERSLVYAYRVAGEKSDGKRGILGLVFRFQDECARIFENLLPPASWMLLSLVDAEGRVLSSSDPHLLPPGAKLPNAQHAGTGIVRFGGRLYLSTVCKSAGYQGYMGPGWAGHAMVPLEFAFESDDELSAADRISEADFAQIMASDALFSPALREIPRAATQIQVALNRAVWNGNASLARADGESSAFSKTLLREIGGTGLATRDVFSRAIRNLNRTVVSSSLRNARSRASLAIDIMDRNLYERANDCRWWALTPAFRQALSAKRKDAAAAATLGPLLAAINDLYTVYTQLLLFDAKGTVVAVSRPASGALLGSTLDAPWVQATLGHANSECYAVSRFAATPLYAGRPTYVYAAAVRDAEQGARVVGGVAIVFDAEPQFRAMLTESLPRGPDGAPAAGSLGIFIDAERRVLASSCDSVRIGEQLELPVDLVLAPDATQGDAALPFREGLYALGVSRSSGYREYKRGLDPYRNDVLALVLVPLSDGAGGERSLASAPRRERRVQHVSSEKPCESFASFAAGGAWYALPARALLEAIPASAISPMHGLPDEICGCVMREDAALPVLDLAHALGLRGQRQPAAETAQVVIVRAEQGRPGFGLLVDELGDNPEVPLTRLSAVPELLKSPRGLVTSIVSGPESAPEEGVLLVLSLDDLFARVAGPVSTLDGERC